MSRLFLLLPAALLPLTVQAQQPADTAAHSLTGNVSLVSQYVSRGFQQTWGNPALQGGIDYAHSSGLFVGTWLSSVNKRFIADSTVEWDVYAGYGWQWDDTTLSTQMSYYFYPSAKLDDVKYDYGEWITSLSWKFFNAKYSHTYTSNYFGFQRNAAGVDVGSRGSGYFELNGNFDLGQNIKLNTHYGWQTVKNFSDANFRDAKIGLSREFEGGWTLIGAVSRAFVKKNVYVPYTVNGRDFSDPTKTTFTLGVTKALSF